MGKAALRSYGGLTRVSSGAAGARGFAGGLALLGAVTVLVLARQSGRPGIDQVGVFLVLGLAFFVANTYGVHLNFRRQSHTVSLVGLPLTAGLFHAEPAVLVTAAVVGAWASLRFAHYHSPVKVLLHVGVACWSTLVAVVAAALIGGYPLQISDHLAWIASAVSALGAAFSAAVLVAAFVSLANEQVDPRRHVEPAAAAGVMALLCATYTLSAGVMVSLDPLTLPLVSLPVAGIYLTNRTVGEERRRSHGLALLYDTSRVLSEIPDLEEGLALVLANLRAAFAVDDAAIYQLLPDGGGAYLSIVTAEGAVTHADRVAPEVSRALWRWVRAGAEPVAVSGTEADPPPVVRAVCDALPLRSGILVPLVTEGRVIGLIALGARTIDAQVSGEENLRLAQVLARNLATALRNSKLERTLVRLRVLQDELAAQVLQDPLTGLANRRAFSERVGELFRKPESGEAGALFIDLDDFKTINDTLGHEAGDRLLTVVAERVLRSVQPLDLVARLGGDEFAVLLVGRSSREQIRAAANKVLSSLVAPASAHGAVTPVNASIGLVFFADTVDTSDLLRKADVAMYAAKSRGKRQLAVFDSTMQEAVVRRYNLQADLEFAASRSELKVLFQPLVDLETGELAGAEALVRWEHPRLGVLLPDVFISLAVETGAIAGITRFVIERAAQFALKVQASRQSAKSFTVMVNASPRDLLGPEVLRDLKRAVAPLAAVRAKLVVEVTEDAVIQSGADAVYAAMAGLRTAGLGVALDDFGTGHSSLNRLREAPVDTIKIAKEFVNDLIEDRLSADVVRAVIGLGHSLGLTVIAEGIESDEQCRRLQEAGCDFGQGYWFSRPLEETNFFAWLEFRGGRAGNGRSPEAQAA